jgi:hypothetical protein
MPDYKAVAEASQWSFPGLAALSCWQQKHQNAANRPVLCHRHVSFRSCLSWPEGDGLF